ncbi:MAG: dihydrodipicolinate synthase family protein [Limnochordales bacterium]|nr:dihydrodipicolinate synthase family protein [Limnochordales bacterium]
MVDRAQNETASRFEGVVALLLTPFQPDGQIDWKCYEAYVDWQLSLGVKALFAVCGSSEMKWLSFSERLELARRAVSRAGRIPVITTANLEPNPAEHKAELHRLIDTGVSGVVLVPPPGLARDQVLLGEYFAELADTSSCPVFLYEWPQVWPYSISPSVFRNLVRNHGVLGIKDTTCTIEGIVAKIRAAPEAIVYQANTPLALDAVEAGARGMMAITSTCCADLAVKFWQLALGKAQETKRVHARLVFLDAILRMAHPATSKYLAALRGIPISPTCRWPVTLHAEVARAVRVWFEEYLEDHSEANSRLPSFR